VKRAGPILLPRFQANTFFKLRPVQVVVCLKRSEVFGSVTGETTAPDNMLNNAEPCQIGQAVFSYLD